MGYIRITRIVAKTGREDDFRKAWDDAEQYMKTFAKAGDGTPAFMYSGFSGQRFSAATVTGWSSKAGLDEYEKNRPFAKAPAHIINALKRSGATITDVIGADGLVDNIMSRSPLSTTAGSEILRVVAWRMFGDDSSRQATVDALTQSAHKNTLAGVSGLLAGGAMLSDDSSLAVFYQLWSSAGALERYKRSPNRLGRHIKKQTESRFGKMSDEYDGENRDEQYNGWFDAATSKRVFDETQPLTSFITPRHGDVYDMGADAKQRFHSRL